MVARIEEIRELGKSSRDGQLAGYEKLLEKLEACSDEDLFVFARGFSKFLNLANIAEQEFFNTPEGEKLVASESKDDPGLISRLKDSGIDPVRIREAIEDLHIDLVLTAHPTEVLRRSMIQKYNEINHCLRDKPFGTSNRGTTRRLEDLFTQSWYSNEIRPQRPTPLDEAKWVSRLSNNPCGMRFRALSKGSKIKFTINWHRTTPGILPDPFFHPGWVATATGTLSSLPK